MRCFDADGSARAAAESGAPPPLAPHSQGGERMRRKRAVCGW
jgi:hypothetical protein